VQQPQVLTPAQELHLLTQKANAGCPQALASLRQFLHEHPQVWTTAGNLSRLAQTAWIDLITNGNALAVESTRRYLAQLQTDLSGTTPSPLEALLVSHVLSTWLAAQHGEITAAGPGPVSLGEASLRFRRAESALKRHLMAVRTLVVVRSMGAGVGPVALLHPNVSTEQATTKETEQG
jgi:hypothetical protein